MWKSSWIMDRAPPSPPAAAMVARPYGATAGPGRGRRRGPPYLDTQSVAAHPKIRLLVALLRKDLVCHEMVQLVWAWCHWHRLRAVLVLRARSGGAAGPGRRCPAAGARGHTAACA